MSGKVSYGLPPNRLAIGSAVNQAIRQLGSVFGVALVIALVGKVSPPEALNAFDLLFAVLLIGGLLISLLSLGIQTKPNL